MAAQAGIVADTRDRFAPVPCFAFDLPLGPAHAQQPDDLVAFRHAQCVHGGAVRAEKPELGGDLSRGLFSSGHRPLAGFQVATAGRF